jgi:RNA polymerase I-specific transcription initiation factor RRN3
VAVLVAHFEDGRTAPITRAAAAAYLASFLARGRFVARETVVGALQALAAWSAAYAARHTLSTSTAPRSTLLQPPSERRRVALGAASASSSATSGEAARHQLFFSAVQAVLYILCYHLEPLMSPRVRRPPPPLVRSHLCFVITHLGVP